MEGVNGTTQTLGGRKTHENKTETVDAELEERRVALPHLCGLPAPRRGLLACGSVETRFYCSKPLGCGTWLQAALGTRTDQWCPRRFEGSTGQRGPTRTASEQGLRPHGGATTWTKPWEVHRWLLW